MGLDDMDDFNDLDELPPIFFPSEGNVDQLLFAPLASRSSSLDCMVGYFSSGVLAELAQSVSAYLKIDSQQPMRFIASPNFNESDLIAIQEAYRSGTDYFSFLFPGFSITENNIKKHTVSALAYLIVSKKIELRVALKKNGLFHAKAWLFHTKKGAAAIHGSSNATVGGMLNNFEQLVLDCSWHNSRSEKVVKSLQNKFEKIWDSDEKDIETIELNEATIIKIKEIAYKNKDMPIFHNEFYRSFDEAAEDEGGYFLSDIKELRIPDYLKYKEGEFAHQGEAVNAWFNNNNKGILSIATGGGKTYTSLIAASLLTNKLSKLFIIIAVPTKALMNQWEDDVKKFGINPTNTNGYSSSEIHKKIKAALRNIRLIESTKSEVIIVTHHALLNGLFDKNTASFSESPTLLIVDEVHNIGSIKSQESFPDHFNNLIGLSATFERQFDEEGTDFLKKIFNGVVYKYGLDRAIGQCLVNYNYYAHFVFLSAEEEDKFIDLTYEIKKISYAANDKKESPTKSRWQRLCLERRALVENAKNKIEKLQSILPKEKSEIQKTLIFCTDKAPEQLKSVNRLLINKGIKFYQITAEETSNNQLLKNITQLFSENKLQVLTSKRVLDEGFNVPQTETAYILASNTVTRQWTQRLGRVLRLSEKTGKKFATIHDFIAIPIIEGKADSDLASLLKSEYSRIEFFSKYCQNYMDKNGGFEATEKLLELMGVS